ncbi:Cro/CI family transcriptional regulator [Marinomonas sp. RSW2]|uniref:Cro/CI family transcriptional regulator n=1 Tax=Marinomonas maritima TaxID=2940935 RepID=A0ABT5WGG9_9GAMM|nr:Cro/CI family transcriptional regulator [Marinomonas maritima]MDE8603926.1 Cro/CI family transcriptional regulator [Marinomonas maritima]
MLKENVIAFFQAKKQNQSDIARKLGVARQTVSCWGDVIPEKQAMKLERITEGALKYDASLYSCQHKQTA